MIVYIKGAPVKRRSFFYYRFVIRCIDNGIFLLRFNGVV